jgi:hypothetical protein
MKLLFLTALLFSSFANTYAASQDQVSKCVITSMTSGEKRSAETTISEKAATLLSDKGYSIDLENDIFDPSVATFEMHFDYAIYTDKPRIYGELQMHNLQTGVTRTVSKKKAILFSRYPAESMLESLLNEIPNCKKN